jgi:hypothetical protein
MVATAGIGLAHLLKSASQSDSQSGGETREATPKTHPDNFEPVKGTPGKRDSQTGEIWVKDKLHKDHYEVYKNKRDFDKGKRTRSVWEDGRAKETF